MDLKRNTADKNVEISISAMDMESFKNVLPENLPAGPTSKLGTKTESVWLNFQCAGGNYLRLGVNPKVSLAIIIRVSLFLPTQKVSDNKTLQGISKSLMQQTSLHQTNSDRFIFQIFKGFDDQSTLAKDKRGYNL